VPVIDEIRWTRQAHRQLGEWVAAFARDLDVLRIMRDDYREEIEAVITASGGYPDGRVEWGPADTRVVEWEFVGRHLWVTHTVRARPLGLWDRLRGRRHGTVLVISALRRRRTPPEREAPDS
jgi:hypothetical protein